MKSFDSSFYFDMTFEEGTPEHVIEDLFKQAMADLLMKFNNRKNKATDILIEGDLTYNEEG